MQAINRQLCHYAYHVGQIVLIAEQRRKGDWASLSVPRGESADFNSPRLEQGSKPALEGRNPWKVTKISGVITRSIVNSDASCGDVAAAASCPGEAKPAARVSVSSTSLGATCFPVALSANSPTIIIEMRWFRR